MQQQHHSVQHHAAQQVPCSHSALHDSHTHCFSLRGGLLCLYLYLHTLGLFTCCTCSAFPTVHSFACSQDGMMSCLNLCLCFSLTSISQLLDLIGNLTETGLHWCKFNLLQMICINAVLTVRRAVEDIK